MLNSLRREYAQLITSGGQLVLLIMGLGLRSYKAWFYILALMALISLFAWASALRRLRLVRDTPTSRIASAAQGYVELSGSGNQCPDAPLLSKFTMLPCLWYRYHVEKRDSDNKWHTEDRGESSDPFLLVDESGSCMIDPNGAEILTMHKDTWQKESYRYTEWKLLVRDYIYAIGNFRTFGGSSTVLDENVEVKNILEEWKENMPELLKNYDLDNDGELNDQEWMLARQAARREAKKRISAEITQPDINYLIQPEDGRLFLISNLQQDNLERRYLYWSWAHLAIFFGALGGIAWLLSKHIY